MSIHHSALKWDIIWIKAAVLFMVVDAMNIVIFSYENNKGWLITNILLFVFYTFMFLHRFKKLVKTRYVSTVNVNIFPGAKKPNDD